MTVRNVGRIDAAIRWLVAAVLFTMAIRSDIGFFPSFLLALGTVALAASALTGWCPLYHALGIGTRHHGDSHHHHPVL